MATVDVPRSEKQRSGRGGRGRKRKSRKLRNALILLLLLVCVAVYLAPMLIARSPLRNSLPQRALKLDGTLSIGSASLGWFSPIEIHDIELLDAEGQQVIEVGQVRTEKPLIGLLLDFGNLGLIEIDQLAVQAVCQEQETNLERLFAELLRAESKGHFTAHVKISEGTLAIEDVPTGRTFHVEKLTLDCQIAPLGEPIVLAASGKLPERRQPGEFKIDLRTAPSADGNTAFASGKIECTSTAIPLELAEPLARRFVERAQLGGRLSTRMSGAWGALAGDGQASVQGEALVTDLAFSAAALGHDEIRLDRVEVPCHLVQHGETLEVEQLAVTCELGNVSLSGTAKVADLSSPDRLAALVRENYELSGEIDLVEVARVLPETLHIRAGTEITSGNIRLAVTSRNHDGQATWSGQIGASRLGAVADGRSLVWENPLSIDFKARQTDDGIVVDEAECTSSFLHASASGSINDLTAEASFDLAQLVSELSQFADMSQLELAGQGATKLTLKRSSGDRFTADGEFQVDGFQFVPIAGGQPWREERLNAQFDLSGKLADAKLARVDRAMLSVEVGRERAIARLREPISDPLAADWPVECTWRGELADWTPRLERVLGVNGWDLRGTGNVRALVMCSGGAIDVEDAQADFAQLHVWGNDWYINEAEARLTAAGRYDVDQARAEISEATFAAGTTSATLEQAVLLRSDDGWKLDGGTARVGAELLTFYRWRHDPRLPATWRVYGRLAAEAELKHEPSVTTAQVNGTVTQLKLVDLNAQAAGTPATWEEPRITLAGLASYRHASEQLKIDKIALAAAAIRADASGSLPLSNQGGDVDIAGTIQYDWQELAPLWRPYLGPGVQISGHQAREFAVRGRLSGSPSEPDSWKQVAAQAAVGWKSIDVHGFAIGQGEIVARLADGQVRTNPMDVEVSDGRFTFSPVIQMTPGPMELYVPRGPLLTNIHLSPEMCRRGLKFVAPIVAETTVAEGRFSISMDGGRVPLAEPRDGDLAGHMAIRAQVKPGPVAEEFLVLVNEILSVLQRGNFRPLNAQTGSLLSIDTNDVTFRMVNRRVYHRNLKFTVGTLPITTYGSVGLDESLSMVAEVPLEAKLFGQDLSLGSLEGQSLKIPIGGTLKKPKLDRGVLRQLTGRLLQNITRGALINEVNKQLERLFPLQQR